MLGDHQDIQDGKTIAEEILKEKFSIAEEDLISCAYIDLILEKEKTPSESVNNY